MVSTSSGGTQRFFWGTRSARMSSEALGINNQKLIEYYEKRDSIQQQIQITQIELKTVMEEKNFQFQYEQGNLNRQFQVQQGELNRQLQAELGTINRLFQAEEGKLNRELQTELTRLNREHQIQDGKFNRKNPYQLELFRVTLEDEKIKEIVKADLVLYIFQASCFR